MRALHWKPRPTGDSQRNHRCIESRGISVLELLIAAAILSLVIGVVINVVHTMTRQSSYAFNALSQIQDAMLLLETVRLELSSMVLNPFNDGSLHEGNSFLISKPLGNSIQFVTERREGAERQRYLVWYDASKSSTTPGCKLLRKVVYRFNLKGSWETRLSSTGPPWPEGSVGTVVETQEFASLPVNWIRWQYLVPEESEGKVFFRLKFILQAIEGKRLAPFTTLVGVHTPDIPTTISGCPCMFRSCFTEKGCYCCSEGKTQ